jgi:hypothetical protein
MYVSLSRLTYLVDLRYSQQESQPGKADVREQAL